MTNDILFGLYGSDCDVNACNERFDALEKQHEALFGTNAQVLFSAAGRTELGGNHTDHNLGKVVAGSISLDTIAAVHKTDDKKVVFISDGYPSITVDISDLRVIESIKGKTDSLIIGVAASFAKRGVKVGGFCANVTSSVLRGSGLSSSASVEVLIASIFNNLYNNDAFSNTALAIIGQEAENNYFGKPCGLMDQVACANGGVVGIDFKDKSNPLITPVKADFAKWGYALVITNVRADHADLTPDYAAIPSEMKSVAKFFGKDALGLVDSSLFYENIAEVRKALNNDRAIIRAHHFFTETDRAECMIKALQNNDKQTYLDIVRESGLSSFRYLQNIYSASHADMQAITIALSMSEKVLGKNCITRVHGGGFAGTIQTYVPFDALTEYCKEMEKLFGENCSLILSIRNLSLINIKVN